MTREPRVYIINCSDSKIDFREKERRGDYEAIMVEAESLGTVYSLRYFEECANNEEIDLSNSFIYISHKK